MNNPLFPDICHQRNKRVLGIASQYDYVALASSRSSESLDMFHENMETTLDSLISSGVAPMVLTDTPSTCLNLSKCTLYNQLGWKNNGDCDLPLSEVDEKHGNYDFIINNMLTRRDFVLVDTKKLLCIFRSCATSLDGVAVYRDRTHLNDVASKALGKKYLDRDVNPFETNEAVAN